MRRESKESRMDAGDFGVRLDRLHNSCVTRLCTGCTRLTNKQLQTHKFH